MPAREETSAVVLMSKDDAARVNGIDLTLITAPTEAGVVGQIPDFVKSIVTAYTAGLKVNMQNVHKFPLPSTDANVTSVAYTPTNIVKLPKFKNATVIEKGFVELRKKDAAAGDESEKAFEKVGIEATFTMTTPVHVELTGVAGAFAGSLRGVDKMKVDSGKYASDPLARSMTMAAVSYRFAPTSVAGVTKTEAQRWAVLGGAVLTPAPGLGGAISRTLIKNLAVNAGWAWMWVPSAPKDLSVDDAVRTEGKQLVYRWTSGLFLGGGYAFGGK